MDPLYIVILAVLGILSVLDLIVGVANDAVNFLNSSMGSRVTRHKVILTVAAAGILVGVLTSNGMMEVARNGVFHPGAFKFTEIMILFGAMMLSDVVLLNTFNRLGLPTSTTVSLVFELLGAAVAVGLFHIWNDPAMDASSLGQFINSGKALVIISGILLSVVVAFTVGAVLMYISRVIFSFRYRPAFRRYGALWCGVSVTGIIYFALFKGLKSSGLIDPAFIDMVNDNLGVSLAIVWGGSSILLWILQLCRINIMKLTILSGTFALALAFAGNDLVNFIGVPLAGLDSFKLCMDSGDMSMTMGALAQPAHVNLWLLLGVGIIMVITLFCSKDAMKVAQTELKLSAVSEGKERFGSTMLSRNLVRVAVGLSGFYNRTVPASIRRHLNSRFAPLAPEEVEDPLASYDHVRAVVNLTAAAILICIGTMYKLPLSTTYVVFMVAMGSSLADRAWGRDSAVYRITGVLVVVSGWFVTALAGFVLAFVLGLGLSRGRWFALALACIWCGYILCGRIFAARRADRAIKEGAGATNAVSDEVMTARQYGQAACRILEDVSATYNHMLAALYAGNRRELKASAQHAKELYDAATARKASLPAVLRSSGADADADGRVYVQMVDYVAEITKALLHCVRPAYDHVDNNHRPLTPEQIADLKIVNDEVDKIFQQCSQMLGDGDLSQLDSLLDMRDALFGVIGSVVDSQIRRLKEDPKASTRASALYFNILNETKTIILHARNLLKAERPLYEAPLR